MDKDDSDFYEDYDSLYGETDYDIESFIVNEDDLDYSAIYNEVEKDSDKLKEDWDRENKRYKLLRVLEIWSDIQEAEMKMKKWVAIAVFTILIFEVLLVGVAFFGIGLGKIKVDLWVAETFIAGMIIQVFAIATIVVKGLFPQKEASSLSEVTQIVKENI